MKKKWVKAGASMDKDKSEPMKSHSAYSRDRGESDNSGSKTAEGLIAMTKAHKEKSASNKTIRNGFYGKKD